MTSEPMTPGNLAAALSAITCAQIEAPEDAADSIIAGLAAGDLLYAEVKRLRCTDPIECGHEAELVEARRDAHTARIDYNLARTRADKAEAQLSAVWALVEPWRSADFVSASLRDLVYGLLSIRDRAAIAAASSSPSEEQG